MKTKDGYDWNPGDATYSCKWDDCASRYYLEEHHYTKEHEWEPGDLRWMVEGTYKMKSNARLHVIALYRRKIATIEAEIDVCRIANDRELSPHYGEGI